MRVDADMIRNVRVGRGLSQEELAAATGLNLRTIQRIESTGSASLRSRRALASALDIEISDIDNKEPKMSPCPHCKSDDVYQYDDLIDTTTIGGELLPKLAKGMFSSAKMRCVVCGDCGLLRYFVAGEALQRLQTSDHWHRVP